MLPTDLVSCQVLSLLGIINILTQGRFIEHEYGTTPSTPFSINVYPKLDILCERILRGFSQKILRQIRDGRRRGVTGTFRPVEASFQDEFYRSFRSLLPGIGIMGKWGVDINGKVDFMVLDPGWGVELLRDGDRIAEHCERFRPNGAYFPSVQSGKMKEHLILDCRHSYPQTTCNPPPLLQETVKFRN